MNPFENLDENDPLIVAMLKASGTNDVRHLAAQIERLDARAGDENFLEASAIYDRLFYSSQKKEFPLKNLCSYVLARKIDRGGFGTVYEGFHSDRPETKVAIKVFDSLASSDIKRIELENLVLQKLDHPNLVRALDAGTDDSGLTYLVMNYIDGIRLDQFVAEQHLDFLQIAKLFEQVAMAIDYAHQHDVLHRDLKPANILVTGEGHPIVTDFGLAKRLNLTDSQPHTMSGQLLGTIGYLAPEQADSQRREVTRTVDVYGLGATLYKILTGRRPFEQESIVKALDDLRTQAPTAPTKLNPAIPDDLERICLKCLAKSPQDRYESMAALASDLQQFANGRPVAARPLLLRQRFWRWSNANPVISGLSVGLGLALLIGLLVSTFLWRQSATQKVRAAQLLERAKQILEYGDKTAESMLKQTAGSLSYRRERLIKSVQFLDELVELYPDDDDLFRDSATSYFRLGKVTAELGMWNEALDAYKTAYSRFLELSAAFPDDHTLRFDVFHSLLGLDNVDRDGLGMPTEQEGKLAESLRIIEELSADHPGNMDYMDALICTQSMVYPRRYASDLAELLERLEAMHEEAKRLKSAFPEPNQKWRYVGATALRIAGNHFENENLKQAEQWLEIARQATTEFVSRPELDPGELLDWVQCIIFARKLAHKMGDESEVERLGIEWIQFIKDCIAKYPDYHRFQKALSESEAHLGLDN